MPQSCIQSTRSLLQLPPLPPLAPALLLASVITARTAALGIALPHHIGGDLAVVQATLGDRHRFRFRKMASAMLKSTVTIVAAVLSMAVLANAQAPSPAPGPEKGAGVLTVPTMIVPVVGMILSLVAGRMLC
uniref:Uncharacterized protein n=1 Tax=Physcomitrium patens TaxID=3218 RepID=A0A7I4AP01_PHYPA